MTSPAPGSPVHSWRMRLRTEWLPSIPKGDEYKALKNLRHFLSCLADFADKDSSNLGKKAVGSQLLAANLGCDRDTIKILYEAAEATGLVKPRHTGNGVRGYQLMHLLPGIVPNWSCALEVLSTDRRTVHKKQAAARDGKTGEAKKRPAPPKRQPKTAPADQGEGAGLPSREGKPDEDLLPSRDSKTETPGEERLPSRDTGVSRHVTDPLPSRDGTTRLPTDINHEMGAVVGTATHPGGEGRAGEAFDLVLIGRQRRDTPAQPEAPKGEDGQAEVVINAGPETRELWAETREQLRNRRSA